MMRQAFRGLGLMGLLAVMAGSAVRAQPEKLPDPPDRVEWQNRKDGTLKLSSGLFTVSPAGFQVLSGDKLDKVIATIDHPDDIVKVSIGELKDVPRGSIQSADTKEYKQKDYKGALKDYQEMLKKTGLPERSQRYLDYKAAQMTTKVVDELDEGKGWKEESEKAVKVWSAFLSTHKTGWELWPAVRASTRLQIEQGKFDDAARTWRKITENKTMPAEAKLEAALQEIDLYIRGTKYASAAVPADTLVKTAVGAKKARLIIYAIAAKAGSGGTPLTGIDAIKAEMEKTKDPSVHATGFSMMGELYLAGKKPREAMWMFLWVETVMNQDRDEVFKAMMRLTGLFATMMDEEQTAKYRDKLKRYRGNF